MTTLQIDKLVSGNLFGYLLIFCRIGCVMMLFPGIGEAYIAKRTRLLLALAISFVMAGPLLPRMPMAPGQIPELFRLMGYEIVIGLFFGTLLRLLMSTLESAGSVIALQSGLSNATILSPTLATQSPLASAFLSITGITLIFVSGMDAMLFRSVLAIYDLFPAGGQLMYGDMAQTIIQVTNRSFVIGIELASPFLVIGTLMFLALGIMQKLMPQVQLFLVALPIQIWGGLALLGITIGTIMSLWLQYLDTSVGSFFAR